MVYEYGRCLLALKSKRAMEESDFGQRHSGDLTFLAEKDGSPSYDIHSLGLSGVSTVAGQSTPLANITYPSGLILSEPVSLPTSTRSSAHASYGTGAQGVEQLSYQTSYGAPLAQPHYVPQQFNTGAPAPTAYGPTSSVLLDGSTLTPLPAGSPLPPRSSTPYLVDTGVAGTVTSRDTQMGSVLPGIQDLTWSTTNTAQAGSAFVPQASSLPNPPGMGRDLTVASERDIEERLAKMQNVMEEKFGMQRKKFMNHMIQVDGEVYAFAMYVQY